MSQIIISTPQKCHLWTSRLTKTLLLNAFDNIKNYRDDYHNNRDLKKCKRCGQLYFAEFFEEIDFREGADLEYYCFIPVDDIETSDKLNNLTRFELTCFTGIVMYFPPHNSDPYWRNA